MLRRKSMHVLVVIVALVLCLGLPTMAWAWTAGSQGNTTDTNSSEIEGSDTGTTEVQGWIGTFDGSDDPNRPDPPQDAWIKVKIPTTALFGSLSTDAGTIYSPRYHIYNYSIKDVKVEASEFEPTSTEPTQLTGMELNLVFDTPNALTVPLRSAADEFLGTGLSSPGTITIVGMDGTDPKVQDFTISGSLNSGFTYPTTSPYEPMYDLVFTFESVA